MVCHSFKLVVVCTQTNNNYNVILLKIQEKSGNKSIKIHGKILNIYHIYVNIFLKLYLSYWYDQRNIYYKMDSSLS